MVKPTATYDNNPAPMLVPDSLITASDNEINAAIPDSTPGMVISNANMSIVRQREHDGHWTMVFRGIV